MTRASSTLTVISIVVVGTWLHMNGRRVWRDRQLHGLRHAADRPPGNRGGVCRPSCSSSCRRWRTSSTCSMPAARCRRKTRARTCGRRAARWRSTTSPSPIRGGPHVLNDVSFTADPALSVALVGHTGAGKSTAMALLQRLWDPTEGRSLIDGQDLRDITLESLRADIGVVFQESLLFNRSIRDNLRVGKPDATRCRDRAGLPHGRCARIHHPPAARLRHHDRRAWHHVVRWSTAASGDRAGVVEEPADPDP